jgi:hypothetical protein
MCTCSRRRTSRPLQSTRSTCGSNQITTVVIIIIIIIITTTTTTTIIIIRISSSSSSSSSQPLQAVTGLAAAASSCPHDAAPTISVLYELGLKRLQNCYSQLRTPRAACLALGFLLVILATAAFSGVRNAPVLV